MDEEQMVCATKDFWRGKDVNELENKVEGHLMNNLQILTKAKKQLANSK